MLLAAHQTHAAPIKMRRHAPRIVRANGRQKRIGADWRRTERRRNRQQHQLPQSKLPPQRNVRQALRQMAIIRHLRQRPNRNLSIRAANREASPRNRTAGSPPASSLLGSPGVTHHAGASSFGTLTRSRRPRLHWGGGKADLAERTLPVLKFGVRGQRGR